jgi:hypothetical protein
MNKMERYEYLLSQGFLPSEARQLSKTTDAGMNAPYFKSMIKSRRSMYANMKSQGWSEQQYADRRWFKTDLLGRHYPDVWKILRYWEDRARDKGQKYASPWKNKGWRPKRRRITKATRARNDRIQLLRSRIKNIDTQSQSAKGSQRELLLSERANRVRELNELGESL